MYLEFKIATICFHHNPLSLLKWSAYFLWHLFTQIVPWYHKSFFQVWVRDTWVSDTWKITLQYLPYRKVYRITARARWSPNWFFKKSTEMSLAPILYQIAHVCRSTVLSECSLVTSECGWQPRQHVSLQHLMVNSGIHFQSFFNGRFWTIRSNNCPDHDTS